MKQDKRRGSRREGIAKGKWRAGKVYVGKGSDEHGMEGSAKWDRRRSIQISSDHISSVQIGSDQFSSGFSSLQFRLVQITSHQFRSDQISSVQISSD